MQERDLGDAMQFFKGAGPCPYDQLQGEGDVHLFM